MRVKRGRSNPAFELSVLQVKLLLVSPAKPGVYLLDQFTRAPTFPLTLQVWIAILAKKLQESSTAIKVAYLFRNSMASTFQLCTMILPQLEEGTHGVTVVGMFFFDDNTYALRQGDAVGERVAKVAKEQGILLMICDQCALRRDLAEGDFEQCGKGQVTAKGVVAGYFPQLYEALSGNPPDQVITL